VSQGVNEGVNEGVNKGVNKKSLVDLIRENPGKRLPFFAEITGKSVKSIEYELQNLRNATQPKIEFRGAPKTGGYYVVDQ